MVLMMAVLPMSVMCKKKEDPVMLGVLIYHLIITVDI